jgi:hypothetical protein
VLLDEIEIHLGPVLLGSGVCLLDHLGSTGIGLEAMRNCVNTCGWAGHATR